MTLENTVCQICSTRPATLFVVRKRAEDGDRTYVCAECARDQVRLYSGANLDIASIVTTAVSGARGQTGAAYACHVCGTTLAEVVSEGKTGCCMCYLRFPLEVQQAVEAAQDRTFHVGKAPAK